MDDSKLVSVIAPVVLVVPDAGTDPGTNPETLPDVLPEMAADSGPGPETGGCNECGFKDEKGCESITQSWICLYNASGCLIREFTNCANDEECVDNTCSPVGGGGCSVASNGNRSAGNSVDIALLAGCLAFVLISFKSVRRRI